jgi:acyl dehydratase
MYFEDFELNKTYDIADTVIEKDKAINFALEYDDTPIHTDEEYAKTTRFRKIIAPGVMSFMAVWNNFNKLDIIGKELIAGKSTKIEWFYPVFIGDVLKSKAIITDKKEK